MLIDNILENMLVYAFFFLLLKISSWALVNQVASLLWQIKKQDGFTFDSLG